MQKAILHRGPDDQGILIDPHGHWGLAHTRLSILDLSAFGRQPMSTPDGKFHLVFNGEIYNFRDLRDRLEKSGHHFTSGTDTEVLLELLARDGHSVLPRLRGMYAFGLLRAEDGHVLLARDSFGIKPLYTAIGPDGELIFASEVRAILASGRIARKINPTGMDGYLRTGSLPQPHSLVQGTYQQHAGTWSEYLPHQAQPGSHLPAKAYFQIGFGARPIPASPQEILAQVRQSLEDTLEAHFVSDVPVGLFLSGGIDSTALAALTAASGRKGLRSYSLGYRESQYDESALTRRVARRFGMDHHFLRLGPDNGRELFQGYLDSLDQPTYDGFNTYCVSSLAARDGTKVVLSGLGGDEVFGGYGSFYRVPELYQLALRYGPRPVLGRLFQSLPSSRIRRMAELWTTPATLERTFSNFRGNFTARESAYLAKRLGVEGPAWDPVADLYGSDGQIDRARFPSDVDAVGYFELARYMRQQLLKDSDVLSMTHGLELRVPLVDTGLFGTIHDLPSAVRYQPGKNLLVSAVPEIPEYVWNHPKVGFSLPVDRWMKGPWLDLFQDVPRQFPWALLSPWYRIWSLKTLTHWLEHNGFETASQ